MPTRYHVGYQSSYKTKSSQRIVKQWIERTKNLGYQMTMEFF